MADYITTAHEAEQQALLRLPLGCDYQGRHPEAAHSATDVGAGADEWVPCNWRDTLAFWATVLAGSAGFVLILA